MLVVITTLNALGEEKELKRQRFSTVEDALEYIERNEQVFADDPEIFAVYMED